MEKGSDLIRRGDAERASCGEWLPQDLYRYRCSNCGILAVSECLAWNYCPNCGAYMRSKEVE